MKHKYLLMALCATMMATFAWAQNETVLKSVDFHNGTVSGNSYEGYGYYTGVITSGSYAHTQTGRYSYWHRVPTNTTSALSALRSVYPRLAWVWGDDFETNLQSVLHPETTTCENGFIMMSVYEQTDMNSGIFNAYIDFGTIDASTASVVDVRFFQHYKKYYDECYLEYRANSSGNWNSIEINTISTNTTSNGYYTYTLPLEAAGQSHLNLRIRWQCRGQRGNAFGYYWIIDDVQVIAANPSRLTIGQQEYVQGGYGIMPQGLNIKPAWYGTTVNNGAITQENVTATVTHLNDNHTIRTNLGSYDNGDIATVTTHNMILDPEGWFGNDQANDYYPGWFGYSNHNLQYGTCDPIPTQYVGDQYLYATLSCESGLTKHFDTIHYSVNGLDNNIQAYRWGRDNGVLAYTPQNHYIYGYTMIDGRRYVSSDPNSVQFNYPGYQVTLRYTTGSEIPAGWVIRGIELVASPIYTGVGSVIKPVLKKDEYTGEGNSVNFTSLLSNAENHTITADEVNNESVVGLNSNGYLTLGNYNSIVILFPEQPELEPQTSYRIGYEVVTGNDFAVATASTYYYAPHPSNPGVDTVMYFRNNSATQKYSTLFPMNIYDVNVYDTAVYNGASLWANSNSKMNAPMIRMLVGPRQQGIGEVKSSRISIYPNPASSQVTVHISESTGTVRCSILDLDGREVISSEWDALQPNTLNIASLSRGVYIMKVTANGKTTVEKLVVK